MINGSRSVENTGEDLALERCPGILGYRYSMFETTGSLLVNTGNEKSGGGDTVREEKVHRWDV